MQVVFILKFKKYFSIKLKNIYIDKIRTEDKSIFLLDDYIRMSDNET